MYKARGLVPCRPPDLVVRLDRLVLDRPEDRIETDPCRRLDPRVLGHLDRWVLCHQADLRVLWETHQGVRLVPCHLVGQLGLAGLYCRFRLDPLHRYRRLGQWWALGRCRRLGLDLYQVHRSVRLDPWDRFALPLEGPWRHGLCWLGRLAHRVRWDHRFRGVQRRRSGPCRRSAQPCFLQEGPCRRQLNFQLDRWDRWDRWAQRDHCRRWDPCLRWDRLDQSAILTRGRSGRGLFLWDQWGRWDPCLPWVQLIQSDLQCRRDQLDRHPSDQYHRWGQWDPVFPASSPARPV